MGILSGEPRHGQAPRPRRKVQTIATAAPQTTPTFLARVLRKASVLTTKVFREPTFRHPTSPHVQDYYALLSRFSVCVLLQDFPLGSSLSSPYTLPVWHMRAFTTPTSSRTRDVLVGLLLRRRRLCSCSRRRITLLALFLDMATKRYATRH